MITINFRDTPTTPDEMLAAFLKAEQSRAHAIAMEQTIHHIREIATEIACLALDGVPMRRNRRRGKAPSRAARRRLDRRAAGCDHRIRLHGDAIAAWGAVADGVCPCETDVEDPGPLHLPTCPWADPGYDGGGF